MISFGPRLFPIKKVGIGKFRQLRLSDVQDGNAEHKVSLDISIQEISAGYCLSTGAALFKQHEICHCPAAVIHP